MTDDEKSSEQDKPEVEGQAFRGGDKVDTPAQVEGQGLRQDMTEDADPSDDTEATDTKATAADETEVEGQAFRGVTRPTGSSVRPSVTSERAAQGPPSLRLGGLSDVRHEP